MIIHLMVCDGLTEAGCPYGSTYRQTEELPTYVRGLWSESWPAHRVRNKGYATGWKLSDRGDRCPKCHADARKGEAP